MGKPREDFNTFADSYLGVGFFVCDVCGNTYRRNEMLTRWDNAKVDWKCNDPYPPQQLPPTPVMFEGLTFWDARPPQDLSDRLTDDTYLTQVTGGIGITNGQIPDDARPGSLSPRDILTGIPGQPNILPQSPWTLQDDITLRTGPIFPQRPPDSDII